MQPDITINLLLCTILYTILFTFGFYKITTSAVISFFTKKNRFKQTLYLIVYWSIIVGSGYLIPDLEQSFIYSTYLSLGIVLWLGFRSTIKQKQSLGDLLFKSRRLSRKFYYYITLTIITLGFTISKFVLIITGKSDIPSGIYSIGKDVDYRIYYSVLIISTLNIAAYFIAYSWRKLEIRNHGISYTETIEWQNISSYYWLEDKPNLLEIEYQNAIKRKLKLKIAVATDEKEAVESIFKSKLS